MESKARQPQPGTAADLADEGTKHSVCVVVEERLLMLAHDTHMTARLGRAFALLVHFVELCGTSDSCDVNLHEAARAMKAPYSTVKSWLAALEASGLVTKTPHGRDGIEIRLNTATIGRRPVFTRIAQTLEETRRLLAAVQIAVASSLAGAEAAVRTQQEALV